MITHLPSRSAASIREAADDLQLLTVEEVADKLKIGRTTVYELIASGELPSIMIRRCRRILPSDLDAYIARLRSEAADA